MSILSVDQISPIGTGTTITLNATEVKTGTEITVGTGASIFSPAGNTLTLGTNSAERLRITNAGAFGLSGTNYGSSGQVLTSQGSGSAPVWSTVSGTTINNNADNRIITGSGTANTLNGESTLTFDGSLLKLQVDSGEFRVEAANGVDAFSVDSDNGNTVIGNIGTLTIPDSIVHAGDSDTKIRFPENNKISFETGGTERLRIDNVGVLYTGNYTTTLDATAGSIQVNGGTAGGRLGFRGTTTSAYGGLGEMHGYWDTNKVASILFHAGGDTSNKDDGEIRMYTRPSGGTAAVRFKIDSNGYVTKPNQPSFHAYRSAGDVSANNYVVFNTVNHNNGSHYDSSNGRFTAPVTGTYFFSVYNYTGGTSAIELRINTSQYAAYHWDDTGGCATWVCPMSAGQYAQIYTKFTFRGTSDYHNGFNGFLIG